MFPATVEYFKNYSETDSTDREGKIVSTMMMDLFGFCVFVFNDNGISNKICSDQTPVFVLCSEKFDGKYMQKIFNIVIDTLETLDRERKCVQPPQVNNKFQSKLSEKH